MKINHSEDSFLPDNDNKTNVIRKYGIKDNSKEKLGIIKFLFLIILCLSFLFVIMFCLYYIGQYKSEIKNKDIIISGLNTRIECVEDMNAQLVKALSENNNFMKEQYKEFMEKMKECKVSAKPETTNKIKNEYNNKTICIIF